MRGHRFAANQLEADPGSGVNKAGFFTGFGGFRQPRVVVLIFGDGVREVRHSTSIKRG